MVFFIGVYLIVCGFIIWKFRIYGMYVVLMEEKLRYLKMEIYKK